MRNLRSLLAFTVVFALGVALTLAFTAAPRTAIVAAQDDAKAVCDSTLVTLLLMAEHDYDYLSSRIDTEGLPEIDFGQFDSFTMETIAMMVAMMEEMSEDDMMAMEAMQAEVAKFDGMTTAEMFAQYDSMMGMEMMEGMTTLEPGNIPGEPEVCATVRADVERFLVSHLLAEASMMMMDEGM